MSFSVGSYLVPVQYVRSKKSGREKPAPWGWMPRDRGQSEVTHSVHVCSSSRHPISRVLTVCTPYGPMGGRRRLVPPPPVGVGRPNFQISLLYDDELIIIRP